MVILKVLIELSGIGTLLSKEVSFVKYATNPLLVLHPSFTNDIPKSRLKANTTGISESTLAWAGSVQN